MLRSENGTGAVVDKNERNLCVILILPKMNHACGFNARSKKNLGGKRDCSAADVSIKWCYLSLLVLICSATSYRSTKHKKGLPASESGFQI